MIGDILGPLAGVVIGGVITHLGTLRVEDRRARREQEHADRVDARAQRQAARMIRKELLSIKLDLASAIERQAWWNRADLEFETPSWERFADVLAASPIDDDPWFQVANAYNEVQNMNESIRRNKRDKQDALGNIRLMFGDETLEMTRRLHSAVGSAIDALDEAVLLSP